MAQENGTKASAYMTFVRRNAMISIFFVIVVVSYLQWENQLNQQYFSSIVFARRMYATVRCKCRERCGGEKKPVFAGVHRFR